MIDLTQEQVFLLIVKAFISGSALGLMYETVRLCRLLFDFKNSLLSRVFLSVLLFITDLLFCLIAASTALLLTYNISGGVFRGCLYFAMGSGFVFYRATLGRLLFRAEKLAVNIIRRLLGFIVNAIIFPFKMIFSLFVKLYHLTIGKIIGKIVYKIRMKKEKKKKEPEEIRDEQLLPAGPRGEEENVDKSRGYRKEGRVSFGGHRGA